MSKCQTKSKSFRNDQNIDTYDTYFDKVKMYCTIDTAMIWQLRSQW